MANPKKKWSKDENLNELLSYLKREKEATFSQINKKIQVSQPTLAEYLKELESENKIEHFDKSENRRNTWYKIKEQNRKTVEAQIGRSEGIKFIENFMKNNDASRITINGSEPEWIRKAHTWIDESTGDPLYFTVIVERKNPKVFLLLKSTPKEE